MTVCDLCMQPARGTDSSEIVLFQYGRHDRGVQPSNHMEVCDRCCTVIERHIAGCLTDLRASALKREG